MEKTLALTEGNIHRQLLRLTLPLLLANVLQQLYNTVNMLIVGRFLGADAYAAVGVSTTVTNLFLFILVGLSLGFSVPFAASFGGGDHDRLRREVVTAGGFGLAVTAALSALGLVLLPLLLDIIHTPGQLTAHCLSYLRVLLLGLPACFLYNHFSAVLRAVGRSDMTLIFLGVSMVANVALSLAFVGGLGWGTAGAALSTVLSQALSAGLCAACLVRMDLLRLTRAGLTPDKDVLGSLARFGSVSALQQSGLFLGKLLIQGSVNAMGPMTITAYTAAACVDSMLIAVGDSGGSALSVFVAQNEGGGSLERVREGLKRSVCQMELAAGVLVLALLPLSGTLLGLLMPTGGARAVSIGLDYLLLEAPFYLLCFGCSVFQGYFRGRGQLRVVFSATMLQIALRVLLTHALAAPMGLAAVAAATGIGWLVMGCYHGVCLVRDLHSQGLTLHVPVPHLS